MTSVVLTNPVDLVQTRWQTSGGKLTNEGATASREGTIRDIVRHVWQQAGARGFLRGTGIRIFYAVSANGRLAFRLTHLSPSLGDDDLNLNATLLTSES